MGSKVASTAQKKEMLAPLWMHLINSLEQSERQMMSQESWIEKATAKNLYGCSVAAQSYLSLRKSMEKGQAVPAPRKFWKIDLQEML